MAKEKFHCLRSRLVYGEYGRGGDYSITSTPVPQLQLNSNNDTDSLANSVSGAVSPSLNAQNIQRVISSNQICVDGNGNMQNTCYQQQQQQSNNLDDKQQSSSSLSINNNMNYTVNSTAGYSGAALGTSSIPRPMQKVYFLSPENCV